MVSIFPDFSSFVFRQVWPPLSSNAALAVDRGTAIGFLILRCASLINYCFWMRCRPQQLKQLLFRPKICSQDCLAKQRYFPDLMKKGVKKFLGYSVKKPFLFGNRPVNCIFYLVFSFRKLTTEQAKENQHNVLLIPESLIFWVVESRYYIVAANS